MQIERQIEQGGGAGGAGGRARLLRCRYCGKRFAFPPSIARRAIKADHLERDRAVAQSILLLIDDAELRPSNRARFMAEVVSRSGAGKPAKTERRRRQANRMFDQELTRRLDRTAHQIIADRAARDRLIREMEAAS